jgi:glucose-1-phosphate cytidylyltransferase
LEARFGGITINEEGEVNSFREKAKDESKWINGGFFVLKSDVFKYLEGDMHNMMWEDEPLERLTDDGQLVAYRHYGFWKCMDALRDKIELEKMLETGQAKWKIWE